MITQDILQGFAEFYPQMQEILASAIYVFCEGGRASALLVASSFIAPSPPLHVIFKGLGYISMGELNELADFLRTY